MVNAEDILYPKPPLINEGMLEVSETPKHRIHYYEYGNPEGEPVIILHGGPGAAIMEHHLRFFDPKHYRIIAFDQRGCGNSQTEPPEDFLDKNTTQDAIDDVEKLRNHLNIGDKAHLWGTSWGSTLALCYAIQHPQKVKSMTLHGIFLGRKQDLDFLFQGDAADRHNPALAGASRVFPNEWQDLIDLVPQEKRNNMIEAYWELIQDPEPEIRQKALHNWARWEMSISKLRKDPELVALSDELDKATKFTSIELNYFRNNCFFPNNNENYILDNLDTVTHIPTSIIHGRYDMVCPLNQASELAEAWKESSNFRKKDPAFTIAESSGHSNREPDSAQAIIDATNRFKRLTTSIERAGG